MTIKRIRQLSELRFRLIKAGKEEFREDIQKIEDEIFKYNYVFTLSRHELKNILETFVSENDNFTLMHKSGGFLSYGQYKVYDKLQDKKYWFWIDSVMDFSYLIKGVEYNSDDQKFVLSNNELRDIIWQHLEQRPLLESKQTIGDDKRLGNRILLKLIEQKKAELELLKETVNNTIIKEQDKVMNAENDLLELQSSLDEI